MAISTAQRCAILAQDVLGAQRQIGGEKGFDGWGWFSLARLFGGGFAMHVAAPRPARGAQATPRATGHHQAWISAPASLGWGDHPVAVCARVLGEPIRSPFLRGAPRRLGVGVGGNS